MREKEIQKLKEEFAKLGGNQKLLKSLGNSISIRTEARLKYEINKLKREVSGKLETSEPEIKTYRPKVDFKDFISHYPSELHEVYIKRREDFLRACSLKQKLNSLHTKRIKQASKLQWEIWALFQQVEKGQKVLDHWRETKRILPTETKEDFKNIPDKKLHLKLRNLRSNRSKRRATIKSLKDALPDPEDDDFNLKFNYLNQKLEELEELDLQIEKLTNIINED